MRRLIEQTACEHDEYEKHCPHGTTPGCNNPCKGGSSREVTLDWAAAAKEVGMIVRGVLLRGAPTRKHDGIDSELEGHWAGRIVGAALGRGS